MFCVFYATEYIMLEYYHYVNNPILWPAGQDFFFQTITGFWRWGQIDL
jgi:hypothetical protein